MTAALRIIIAHMDFIVFTDQPLLFAAQIKIFVFHQKKTVNGINLSLFVMSALALSTVSNLLDEFISNQKWVVDHKIKEKWLERLRPLKVDRFQVEEILHFLTFEQLTRNVVNLNPDKDFVHLLFANKTTVVNTNLQSPAITFQTQKTGFECPFCNKFTGYPMQEQHRASDEPGRFRYLCSNCEGQWFTN